MHTALCCKAYFLAKVVFPEPDNPVTSNIGMLFMPHFSRLKQSGGSSLNNLIFILKTPVI